MPYWRPVQWIYSAANSTSSSSRPKLIQELRTSADHDHPGKNDENDEDGDIIIMFPTLQCLDPWEFAVRLSQQRCARSYSLLLLLSPALAVQYCIAPVQCFGELCRAKPKLCRAIPTQLCDVLCRLSGLCHRGCAVARHKAAGQKDL